MVAIPLSMVGIVVGHWIMGAFFTATSFIGMIALAGIMVRNSVLLIDFVNLRLAEGIPLKQAVIEAGAVRTTPILLTAGTVVIGAFVILFDPIPMIGYFPNGRDNCFYNIDPLGSTISVLYD